MTDAAGSKREQELALSDELLDGAAASAGSVVLLAGPAGIRKTSLVNACAQATDGRGTVMLGGIGDELLTGPSLAAVRDRSGLRSGRH